MRVLVLDDDQMRHDGFDLAYLPKGHEVVHALRPSWKEKRVNSLAEDLAAALWRLGYRRNGP